MAHVKLVTGQVYDYSALIPAGWSDGQSVFSTYGGIYHGEYFADVDGASGGTGRYYGPDDDGVEPLYETETAADLIDSDTGEALRKATVFEMEASLNSGQHEGHLIVDGRRCYVA